MQLNEIKAGDVVRLKSGGPTMTVTGFNAMAANRVMVAWFDDKELRTASIHSEALEVTTKGEPFVAFVG